ncbi:MAG: flavodoxin family protein, partial [Gammaproteobacteria bacterium]|nr:flavodoxin family protein [Gammaproteobacteria bacterium]
MNKNCVVYFSGYGHTERLAQLVAEGAQARLIVIDQQGDISKENWDELAQAKSIIFGSPTYMGSVSWQFKKFADATSKCWYARLWQNKVAGGFTISASPSGDKFSTIQYMITLAMQNGMIWVGQLALPSATLNRLGG